MASYRKTIRVHARDPLVLAFIKAWNAAVEAPQYLGLEENTAPWDRMARAMDALLDSPAARHEARYLQLHTRTYGELRL